MSFQLILSIKKITTDVPVLIMKYEVNWFLNDEILKKKIN